MRNSFFPKTFVTNSAVSSNFFMVGFLLKIQPAQQIQRHQGGDGGGGVLLSCIKVPPPCYIQ